MKSHRTILFTILISLSIFTKSYAQDYLDYYKIINTAEIAAMEKRHAEADSAYRIAFKMVPSAHKLDYLNAAKSSASLGDYKSAAIFLDSAVSKGLEKKEVQKLTFYQQVKSNFTKNYAFLRRQYEARLDKKMIRLVDSIFAADQQYRHGKTFMKKATLVKKTDFSNYVLMRSLVQKYGWVGFRLFGDSFETKKNLGVFRLIIIHFQPEEKKFFLPYLLEAVKKGDAYPYQYAHLCDRVLMDEMSPQYYGSMKTKLPGSDELVVYPIDTGDFKEVDKRRDLIGLQKIEYELKENPDIKYDQSLTFERYMQIIEEFFDQK